jgi:flavorubredoxin
MSIKLYRDAHHECLMFTDLIEGDQQAVQANQFLIIDNGTGCVIDPGGNIAFNELYLTMSRFFPPHALSYLIASHAEIGRASCRDRVFQPV